MKRSVRFLALCAGLVAGSVAHAKDLSSFNVNAQAPAAPASQAILQQAARAGGSVSAFDARRGAPSFLWATTKLPATGAAVMPDTAARQHVARFAGAYGLSSAALGTAEVAHVHDLGRGAVVVTLRQRLDGVEVYRSDMKVLMKQNLELVAISGSLHPAGTPQGKPGTRTFKVGSSEALARAVEKLYGIPVPTSALKAAGRSEGGYERFDLAPTPALAAADLAFTEPARVKRVFFPVGDRLVPAYFVEIYAGKTTEVESDYARYVMAADDGRMLYRENLTAYDAFSYRVWADPADGRPSDNPQEDFTPHPTGVPDGSEPGFAAPILISIEGFNTNPGGGVDPWLPAGAVQTLGNNVDAYSDHLAPDGFSNGDMRATVTSSKTFDRTYDVSLEPTSSPDQIMASTAHLFYVNNWIHDYFYDSGFNEAAGNAQAQNFGRGGLGGDVLKAEAQDNAPGGSRNNANMNTPADGVSPRMQMFLYSATDVVRTLEVQPIGLTPATGVAGFGPTTFNIPGELLLVNDGAGASPSDACELPFANAADIAGKVALIDRGNCTFKQKAVNAEAAGAVGLVIINTATGGDLPPAMPNGDPTAAVVTIPAMSVGYSTGNSLKAALGGAPLTANLHRVPGVERDGTLENTVVVHEWGHYLHHRLSDCGTPQCGGMSEGWGDFMSMFLVLREGDNLDGVFARSIYAARYKGDSGYYGSRRLPYTTDLSKNPLTFQHMQDGVQLPQIPMASGGATNAEVHNVGEIWASMLFEGYVGLLKRSQGPNPPYTFAEARRLMADYVVAGLKMAPPDGTFTEVRDAVLAAAAAQNPDDAVVLAEGFAKRGAGSCAASPDRYSSDLVGVVEAQGLQPKLEIASVILDDSAKSCDLDGALDAEEIGKVKVEIHNPSVAPLVGAEVRVTLLGQGVSLPSGDTALVDVPAFGSATASIDVALDESLTEAVALELGVSVEHGDACVTSQLVQRMPLVNFDDVPASSTVDDAESEHEAWARAGDHSDEIWSRAGGPLDNHVWHGIDYGGAASDTSLISPDLVVSATDPFLFSFEHTYKFEASTTYWDGGVIELSDDGGATWTDLGALVDLGYTGALGTTSGNPLGGRMAFSGQNPSYPALDIVSVDLGTQLAGKTVRLRFRIGTDQNTGSLGWRIDNLHFEGITNTPFGSFVADQTLCQLLPEASAGPDQTVPSRAVVTLDASASTDPNSDALAFTWSQTGGPQADAWATDGSKAIFVAPEVKEETTLTFSVEVSDGQGATSDTVTVTVLPVEENGTGGGGSGEGGTGGVGGEGGSTGADAPKGDAPQGDSGCGCAVAGDDSGTSAASLGALAALGLIIARRRRRPQA